MSLTNLPLLFWGYALEIVAFILNRAPSKSVKMTPYELWFGKKPKLSFLKVWGCDTYVKRLQPDKLEPNRRSVSSKDTLRKQLGTPSTTDPKARSLLPRMEPF